ncbi:MAG: FmdB family transcriptional regulator [Acidimicrobiales bacterium]|nr:FmdB family transcriptional regulator [Acidimicrobiales bacterium]
MPTYEYMCKACGVHSDIIQSFSDDPVEVCPACGAKALKKVFGSVGIVFKGSGFYKTDSRSSTTASATPTPSESKNESVQKEAATKEPASKDSSVSSGNEKSSDATKSKSDSTPSVPAATSS